MENNNKKENKNLMETLINWETDVEEYID